MIFFTGVELESAIRFNTISDECLIDNVQDKQEFGFDTAVIVDYSTFSTQCNTK